MDAIGKTILEAALICEMRKLLPVLGHVESYLNDLIVYAKNCDTHLQMQDKILPRQALLRNRPTKCLFGLKSVKFLGRLVCGIYITFNEKSLETIRQAKQPTAKK